MRTGQHAMTVTDTRHESKTWFVNTALCVIRAKGYSAARIENIGGRLGERNERKSRERNMSLAFNKNFRNVSLIDTVRIHLFNPYAATYSSKH